MSNGYFINHKVTRALTGAVAWLFKELTKHMNIELTDGFILTADATNYELHHGSITYYYRNITDALDRYLELVRKDKTQKYDGSIDKYVEEIKKVNMETTRHIEELLRNKVVLSGGK